MRLPQRCQKKQPLRLPQRCQKKQPPTPLTQGCNSKEDHHHEEVTLRSAVWELGSVIISSVSARSSKDDVLFLRGFNRHGHTRGSARARVDGVFFLFFEIVSETCSLWCVGSDRNLLCMCVESHKHICRIVSSLFDPSRSERHFFYDDATL